MIKLQTERILIPVDFTATAMKAVKHGAFLAKRNKGELYLLHVLKKKEIENFAFPAQELREMVRAKNEAIEKLAALAKQISAEYSIKVTPLISRGKCTKEIARTAEKHNIGLIVMGTRGSDSTSTLFFGSNSNRVISRANIPVMTVRNESQRLGYSKILIPIDASEHSRQKVNSALQLAKMFASTVNVLGILEPGNEAYRYKMAVILHQIKKMADKLNLVCHHEIVVSSNPAAMTLFHARKTRSELIVSMTDQNPGASKIISGSFDQQLVDEAEIPVLSIQPEIHEENYAPVSIGGMW